MHHIFFCRQLKEIFLCKNIPKKHIYLVRYAENAENANVICKMRMDEAPICVSLD